MGAKTRLVEKYGRFLSTLKMVISTKDYNHINIGNICRQFKMSTNAGTILVANGYIQRGSGRDSRYKATASLQSLTDEHFYELMAGYSAKMDKRASNEPANTVQLDLLPTPEMPAPILQAPNVVIEVVQKMPPVRLDWQPVPNHFNGSDTPIKGVDASRAIVPGGWLLRLSYYNDVPGDYQYIDESVTFIPDPAHQWQ